MRLRSAEPFWLLKNGILQSFPTLQENIDCDVLIVGGGITGALMAYQLSSEGYKTILIDKRDIGLGSTSASTSMLQYEIDEPLYSLIHKVGEDIATESYREGVIAINRLKQLIQKEDIHCEFELKKSLYIARSPRDQVWLEKEYAARATHQLEVQWLNKEKIASSFGLDAYGGILSRWGGVVDVYKLTHELIRVASAKWQLKVYDHTAMAEIIFSKEKNTVKTDGGFLINSRQVVFATGFESKDFFRKKFVKLISTFAFVSEPLKNIPERLKEIILWDTEDPYLYMRQTSDNRILVGGADESFKNEDRRDRLIAKKETELVKKIGKVLPGVKLIPDFSWAGTFGVTKDSLPYIGPHPDYPGCYFVLGFGGNGITFSVMGMKIISDALAGRNNKFLHWFRFLR